MKRKVHIILPDIRSAYNVGSIFRSADCFGVEKIYIVGTTPSPVDRWGRDSSGPQKEIAKTALGAEKTVVWEYVESLSPLLKKLKKEGFHIVAIEQDDRSISLQDFNTVNTDERLVLVFGSEVGGLAKDILKKMNTVIELPMKGEKESLNVSVCAGVVMYEILK